MEKPLDSQREGLYRPALQTSSPTHRDLLFVDILNYTTNFFRLRAAWPSPLMAFREVQLFVDAAGRSGWTLEVFIDDWCQTSEAMETWRLRREKEVRKRTRKVPQAVNRLFGDMFTRLGVRVHYSHEADNDDTIVAHAFARSAAVLSADRDMYRYTGITPPLRVFHSFAVHGQRLQLSERPPSDRASRSCERAVIVPPPATNAAMHSQWGSSDGSTIAYLRGSPSPLTRDLGNIHLAARTLRQAVYHRLGVKGTVHEVFPMWDGDKVAWTDDHVAPDPEMSHLLADMSPDQVVARLFPDFDSPPSTLRPELVHNHAWAVRAVVYELLVIGSGGSPSLFDMMERDPFFGQPQQSGSDRDSYGGRGRGRDRGFGQRGGRGGKPTDASRQRGRGDDRYTPRAGSERNEWQRGGGREGGQTKGREGEGRGAARDSSPWERGPVIPQREGNRARAAERGARRGRGGRGTDTSQRARGGRGQ